MDKRDVVCRYFEDKRNYRLVLGMCRRYYADYDDAKDATQNIIEDLIKKAEGINFPEDNRQAYYYMWNVVRNRRVEDYRKSKRKPVFVNDPHAIRVQHDDEIDISIVSKLDKLNEMIIENAHLFTPLQLTLWECTYKFLPTCEVESILGKKSATIYSLRNKLLMKIRKLFKEEDLY